MPRFGSLKILLSISLLLVLLLCCCSAMAVEAGGAVVVVGVVVDVLLQASRIFLPRVCWAVLMTMPVELMPRKKEKEV
jgi:hypothetical protein